MSTRPPNTMTIGISYPYRGGTITASVTGPADNERELMHDLDFALTIARSAALKAERTARGITSIGGTTPDADFACRNYDGEKIA